METQVPETPAVISAEVEKLHSGIKAKFNHLVDVREVKFSFRKVVDEKSKVETKRDAVELAIPVPSVEGIIAAIEAGGKGLELLLEAAADVVLSRAREIVNEKEDINQDNFPLDKLTWEDIANLPKAERRGGGISKEIWDDFAKDYIHVMPAVTGKSPEQIGNAAKILLNKFNAVKSNKPVLKLMQQQLALYINNTANAELYKECVDFLSTKVDGLLSMTDEDALANL